VDQWPEKLVRELADIIAARAFADFPQRCVIAIAGGPAAGKSTLAVALVTALNNEDVGAQVLPMDGFHIRAKDLARLGLTPRKGAYETFDLEGLTRTLALVHAGGVLRAPAYSREVHDVIDDAIEFQLKHRVAIVEGNYLLLDRPDWRQLRKHFDLTIFLESDEDEARRRLIARHLAGGMALATAEIKVEQVDLQNRELVAPGAADADLVVSADGTLRRVR
jgi:pantothenate kinase